MEILGEPLSEFLATAAITITTMQFLSGIFMINDIRKAKSSQKFSSIPFLGSIVLTVLNLKYAVLLRDDAMVKTNLIGFALNVVYTCIYYLYMPPSRKMNVWVKIGLTFLCIAAGLFYSEYEDKDLVENRFGILVTILLIAFVGSPLLSLEKIIKNKNTGNLPFPIILTGTLVSLSWALYGLSINHFIIVVQNLILLSLGVAQLSLFIIYPKNKMLENKKKSQ